MSNIFDNIDKNVNLRDDFYKYATGKWIENNPQPEEYPTWNVFTQLGDMNIKRIKSIITDNNDDSVISKKINMYYDIITNYDKRNKEDYKPGFDYIWKHIFHPNNAQFDNVTNNDFVRDSAQQNLELFFDTGIAPDSKGSGMYEVYIYQSGLGLGNKDYYLNDTEDNKKVVDAYKTYIADMYSYYFGDGCFTQTAVKNIWDIEMKLAKVSYSEEELQDPVKNYNKMSVKDLSEQTDFDWNTYLCDMGFTNTEYVIVSNLEFLKVACNLLKTIDLQSLRDFYRWSIMTMISNKLSDAIYDINFKFSQVLSGATVQMPKEKRAINNINNIFSDAVGQIYVKKYFSEESKNDVIQIVNNLKKSFAEIIKNQEWMSEETKDKALDKLNSMVLKIGYPDKWEDFSDIPIDEKLSYLDNYINVCKYFKEKTLKKYYNKPIDKSEWYMDAQTINACYNPVYNEICFPAGILQAPFYDVNASVAQNYGGIGCVIAHEMTHAFDNHGRLFDKYGKLNDWWSKADSDNFEKLVKNTIDRFNSIEALPGLNCNGTLTLGENIADFGGVKIAYNACKEVSKGTDWINTFFIAYANNWAGVTTEEAIRNQIITNEHSINSVRVNGTLPMFNEWIEYYNVTPNNKLYVEEDKRAKIW